MTDPQRLQLRKIIDLNWEVSLESDIMKKFEMARELSKLIQELRDDMGHEEYDHFMDMGRKMLAPKEH